MCEECERLDMLLLRRLTESLLFALVFTMQNPLLEKKRAVPSAGKQIQSFQWKQKVPFRFSGQKEALFHLNV